MNTFVFEKVFGRAKPQAGGCDGSIEYFDLEKEGKAGRNLSGTECIEDERIPGCFMQTVMLQARSSRWSARFCCWQLERDDSGDSGAVFPSGNVDSEKGGESGTDGKRKP